MANTDWTMDGMNDPLLLQQKLLNRFEEETGTAIVDPNNTPCLLMEAFASTTAGLVRKLEDTVRPAIYPARAKEAVELYKHLSDYEYVNVFATPAQTTLLMTLDKAYVMANAMSFTDSEGITYYKLIIPKTTIFTIGDHKFGLYYPIEIRCNVTTNRLYIVYDTSELNPMHALTSNVLEYDMREVDGHDIIYLKIPVYQFQVDVYDDNVVIGSGYKRVITYADRFYALRAKASVLQNPGHDENVEDEWAMEEIKLCASGMTYDTDTVTMVFTPDPDTNSVTLEIPYIYFSKGLINGDVEVEIYTTEGEINYTLPSIEEQEELELCSIDMFNRLVTDDGITPYVDPFRRMPALSIVPLNTAVVGGTNGMDLETLRRHVVNGTLHTKTLQTPADIDAYFEAQGYKTTILRDGVTDRIYLVHSSVTNVLDEIISAGTLSTIFDFRPDNLKSFSTIVGSDNGHIYTVLPSTIYKFDTNKGVVTPLTDTEREDLNALDPADLVEEYNKSIYTLSPFHLQVDTSSRYPTSITYDMRDTEIKSRQFIGDRDSQEYQLILNSVVMAVEKSEKNPLTDKYTFTFNVSSSGLDDVDAIVVQEDGSIVKNFRVICGLKNVDGSYYFAEAKFLRHEDNSDYFQLSVYSDYRFHQDANEHSVELTTYGNGISQNSIFYLTSEMRVMLTINGDIGNIKDPDGDGIVTASRGIITDYTNAPAVEDVEDFYALTEYRLACKFGSVVDELDQRINLTYSQMEYLKYGYTKFKTLAQPMYLLDSHNELIIRENPDTGKLGPVPLFDKGYLECLTQTIPETVTFNEWTIENYIGCKVTGNPTGMSWETVPSDLVSKQNGYNKTFTLEDAPIVPRFKVTDASDVAGTSTIAIGTYELLNAKTKGGLASYNDVWMQPTGAVTVGGETKWVNKFIVEDVLQFIKRNKTVVDHVDFESYTPHKGEFVVEINISRSYWDDDDDSPIIGPIDPTQTFCRIWYCYNVKLPMAELARIQDLLMFDTLVNDQGWRITTQVEDPEHPSADLEKCVERYCGFVYRGMMKEHSPITDTDISQEFVHFFRTKTLDDGAVIPDLSYTEYVVRDRFEHFTNTLPTPSADYAGRVVRLYTDTSGVITNSFKICVETSTGVYEWQNWNPESSAKDEAWKNNCEKYPWDCEVWYAVTVTNLATNQPAYLGATAASDTPENETLNLITVDSKFAIDLDEARMYKYLVHSGKQYDLDEYGNLQEDPNADSRHIQYMISMLQIDAKHNQVTATNEDFIASIVKVLRVHFDNLGNTRNEMFTNTRLFFEAFKSIGYGTFRIGPDVTENLQLDIAVSLRLHVTSATATDDTLRDSIYNQIVYIIDTKLQQGYLNLNEVANQVMTDLAGTVLMVDVLGINGREEIQTLKSLDDSVRPHLKHSLVLLDDGNTIDVSRGLSLEFVVDD